MPEIIDAYCTPGTERETRLSAEDLLRDMDRCGIARAVIAPEDREIALANEAGNERVLALAAKHAGRFIPACSVNPWHGARGGAMLEKAVRGGGARMLVLSPYLQGFIPPDELLDDLLRSAAAMRVPVYIHTGPHSGGSPAQTIFLAERHPDTRFILGHGGSTDHAWDMRVVLTNHRTPNLWFELSFVRPWVIHTLGNIVGDDRLLFGTSAPRNDIGQELSEMNRSWPIEKNPNTYGGNIARLVAEVKP